MNFEFTPKWLEVPFIIAGVVAESLYIKKWIRELKAFPK